MHYRLEIIMPKVDNIESAIAEILNPFYENNEEHYGYKFWDWYVIGGRWSGKKLEESLDQEKLKEFNEKLNELKITVSGFQAGKQEINPSSQIPIVDNLWKEYFPKTIEHCPFFKHSGKKNDWDIMELKNINFDFKSEKIIFAGLSYDNKQYEAKEMFQQSFWNGVSDIKSEWDGNFSSALRDFKNKINKYNPEYAEKIMPKDDWLVLTIDYHS